MAVGGTIQYPTLNEIANLVRTFVDDDKKGATGTAGEGQILTDASTTLSNLMNSAIREIARECKIMGQLNLIADNYIIYALPPVNSPLGVGVPNPAVQVALQTTGYFDGLLVWSSFTLPSNILYPLEIWARQSGSSYPFQIVKQAPQALSPSNQGQFLGQWEWRQDGLWFNGSTLPTDIRLRYEFSLSDIASQAVDWDTTYVPILDCQEAVADNVSVRYARRLGGATLEDAKMQAKQSIFKLRQQYTRSRQGVDNQRPIFRSSSAQPKHS